jgi:glutamate carboxypeptidase
VPRTHDSDALLPAALMAALAAREGEMLDQLRSVVALDSGSYDSAGVDAVGDLLEAWWSELGFVSEQVAVPGAGRYRRFTRALGGRGRVLILGHLDTVWPKGPAAEWPFRIAGGLAHGPGVGDMKGGLVMARAAVASLLASAFDGVGEIRHVLVPDEELGSVGSRALIEAEARSADWVLVLEPARDNGAVVVERGAVGAIVVRANGISAHVMHRSTGASAIRALAAMVEPLEALSNPANGEGINVGILRGGDARQVVPRDCEMHIDLRAADADGAERLLGRRGRHHAPRLSGAGESPPVRRRRRHRERAFD